MCLSHLLSAVAPEQVDSWNTQEGRSSWYVAAGECYVEYLIY